MTTIGGLYLTTTRKGETWLKIRLLHFHTEKNTLTGPVTGAGELFFCLVLYYLQSFVDFYFTLKLLLLL